MAQQSKKLWLVVVPKSGSLPFVREVEQNFDVKSVKDLDSYFLIEQEARIKLINCCKQQINQLEDQQLRLVDLIDDQRETMRRLTGKDDQDGKGKGDGQARGKR